MKNTWTRKRWLIGYYNVHYELFSAYAVPESGTYGFVEGPYRTKRAAALRMSCLGASDRSLRREGFKREYGTVKRITK